MIKTLAVLKILAMTLPKPAIAKPIYRSFGWVSDGDTIVIKENGKETKIRLAFIDAPELGQKLGPKSQQALASLLKGVITRKDYGTDRYGRVLAEVYADGKLVNVEMVRLGMAFVYYQFAKNSCDLPLYTEAESQAKRRGLGVWNWNSYDVTPEEYRLQHRIQ